MHRFVKRTIGTSVAVLLALAFGANACGPQDDDVEQISTKEDSLYYVSAKLWSNRDISVCWATPNFDEEKELVEKTMKGQRSWEAVGAINFVGWGPCSGGEDIRITAGNIMGVSYLGTSNSFAEMILDFRSGVETLYSRCASNGLTRNECIKTVAIHEFGHAIGYAHEHNRPDTDTTACTSAPQGTDGDMTYGAFDVDSIMAYCNFTTELSPTDVAGTARLYGASYGDRSVLGDYNGDGYADILCHQRVDGTILTDFGSSSGYQRTDAGTDTDFCVGSSDRLYKGDFNGDGRTDLLCHNLDQGFIIVDFADGTGRFAGLNYSRGANWCRAQGAYLYIGDFNGDGRDDLLCHNSVNGYKHIDFASSTGRFEGTDWSRAARWCRADVARLHVGDFNGDGRDDILCHNISNGWLHVDLANSSGQFWGTNWDRDASWCKAVGAELKVGDFNGDSRADLLCHNTVNGYKHVDLADSQGRFFGTDFSRDAKWCHNSGKRLFIGDANDDGRDDMLCHDISNGEKWLDYADSQGRFYGTDWNRQAFWCNESDAKLH